MDVTEQECGECGASDWKYVLDSEYPEHRRERDRTVRTVYACTECGSEGRHFDHQNSGTEQLTGALRQ